MLIKDIILERDFPKNKWELVISTADKSEVSKDLINLVKNAYSVTAAGSMVNSMKDVLRSDWHVIDWDQEDDVDVAIFYRPPRSDEPWKGNKIQGLGHDGQRESKDKGMQKLIQQLNQPGWWIEASDAVRHVLLKSGAPVVKDEETLKKIFPDSNLTMIDDVTYTRMVDGNTQITETVFGKPIV